MVEFQSSWIKACEKDLVKLPTDFLEQYQIYIVTLSIKFEDDTIYNKIFKGLENL